MITTTFINNKENAFRENLPLLFSFSTGSLFLITESWLFIEFLNGNEEALKQLLIAHTASILTFLTGCIILHKKQYDIKSCAMLLIYSAILGPIGIFSMTAMSIIYILTYRSSTDFLSWLSALFPEYSGSKSEDIFEQIIYSGNSESDTVEIEPFSDIMEYGTIEQRQLAIVRISQHFKPKFAPILLNALHDEENTVRVQAASALATIEDNFSRRYQTLKKETAAEDVDKTQLFQFAFLCNEYANSGLIASERSYELRNSIIETTLAYLNIDPDNLSIKMLLAHNYFFIKEYEKAETVLEETLKTEINSENSQLYLSTLFKQKKFDKVSTYCVRNYLRIKAIPNLPLNHLKAVKLWKQYSLK